jgi:predicted aldo/keto reductase-like oxidoreductase
MHTRRLGRSGLEVSAISLGTEYLLNEPREDAVRVIHAALDRGINYYDIFYAQPEIRDTMGLAFRGRRHEALITTHLGGCVENGQHAKTRDVSVAERYVHDYFRRLETDYVDVLFLHNCDEEDDYQRVMDMDGLLGVALRMRDAGQARLVGFSGHTVATSLQAVESGVVDVLMFPVNLLGNAIPGKRDLLAACQAHDVALVAMKPFAGGRLLSPQEDIHAERWQVGGEEVRLRRAREVTPIRCLSYILEQPGVSTIVPGCRTVAELDAALAYWEATPEERDFSMLLADFAQYREGECVYCNHCLPCPQVIDIGQTMRLLDAAQRSGPAPVRAAYDAMAANAADCIACGDCEARCPFGVEVISRMEEAAALFA